MKNISIELTLPVLTWKPKEIVGIHILDRLQFVTSDTISVFFAWKSISFVILNY